MLCKILKHCGMVMDSGIKTTFSYREIDWVLCTILVSRWAE
ncbi:hypothetical protein HMPREF0650_0151 [Hoylesella buccalis ATCC 35310]|uniref:Uncharacterized protein n=1 Tax=Hoylesella buccalis ATCC 35310 TaxID=679190 RepID=D1W2P7_9BACT|nr:hypothetical protein HMPREF0650_0151 [Hoylesella buccalis ATCC 35310]